MSTVTLEPRPERVRVFFGDTLVADSTASVLVHETGLPPRRYVPPADVKLELFARAAGVTTCPYKGDWSWMSVRIGDRLIDRAAWTYHGANDACESIKDFVAFDEAMLSSAGGSIDVA